MLREYIDWQPFFNAWEMKGRFPDILNNPASGETARKLWDDAQSHARHRSSKRTGCAPTAWPGLFPAACGRATTCEVYTDEDRGARSAATLYQLRQQGAHREGIPQPLAGGLRGTQGRAALRDYVGGFAVTAGLGVG